jgi:hypothetical protein
VVPPPDLDSRNPPGALSPFPATSHKQQR